MIIGNGLVAGGFKQYRKDKRCLIFASGVSNSTNSDSNAFCREQLLLEEMINTHGNKTFVYFSTCSVYDPSMQNSPYVLHKLSMEAIIKRRHNNYHIFRISNLAGQSGNPHTFLNFFIQ